MLGNDNREILDYDDGGADSLLLLLCAQHSLGLNQLAKGFASLFFQQIPQIIRIKIKRCPQSGKHTVPAMLLNVLQNINHARLAGPVVQLKIHSN